MKHKYKKVMVQKDKRWSDWQYPVMTNYRMKCCDCGLVHVINFNAMKVIKAYKNGVKLREFLPKKDYVVAFKIRRAKN